MSAFVEVPQVEVPQIEAVGLTFSQMAGNMIKRGVPVTIVAAKGKNPLPFAWQLNPTTKKTTLLEWIRKYGNNCNCGSVATPDTVWILDDDSSNVKEAFERETGLEFPRTFTVSSRPGRFHYYFKQTDASRAMGNRSLHSDPKTGYKAPYEFDAQQNRRQVISPGSTHPLGFIYQTVDDVPIVESSDALCEWVAAKGKKEKSKSTAGKKDLKTSPDFEAVDFWEHFNIAVEDDYGSNWYVTPECPYCGHAHEHSKKTAFYWDGVHFGFHCFAGGCGDPSIGDLIRKLNEDHEPFPGEIWPGFTQPELNDPRFNLELDEVVIEPEKAPRILSMDEVLSIVGGIEITKEEALVGILVHRQ